MNDSNTTFSGPIFFHSSVYFSCIFLCLVPCIKHREYSGITRLQKKKSFSCALFQCAHNNLITLSHRRCINEKFLTAQLWNYAISSLNTWGRKKKSKKRIGLFSHQMTTHSVWHTPKVCPLWCPVGQFHHDILLLFSFCCCCCLRFCFFYFTEGEF